MDIREFLNREEIKELIRIGDLNAVYDKCSPPASRSELSNYLLELGINPMNYFEDFIPAHAFFGCDILTSVVIPDSVVMIENSAFTGCRNLKSVVFSENSRLTTIDIYAFGGCIDLTEVTIPDTVTFFGKWAFADCRNLASIQYRGTKAQWEKISKHRYWQSYSPIGVIYCTDGYILLDS